MSLMRILFSFSGRIDRAIWWAVYIVTGLIYFLIFKLIQSGFINNNYIIEAIGGGVGVLQTWSGIAVGVKRLHDIGRSGWNLAWLAGGFWLFIAIIALIKPEGAENIIIVGPVTFIALSFYWLGFKAGDAARNKYGEPPSGIEAASEVHADSVLKARPVKGPVGQVTTTTREELAADPYQQAGEEILAGRVDPAIWARALVEFDGNDSAVKAAYIRLRVSQLNAKALEVKRSSAAAMAGPAAGHDPGQYAPRGQWSESRISGRALGDSAFEKHHDEHIPAQANPWRIQTANGKYYYDGEIYEKIEDAINHARLNAIVKLRRVDSWLMLSQLIKEKYSIRELWGRRIAIRRPDDEVEEIIRTEDLPNFIVRECAPPEILRILEGVESPQRQ